MADQKKKEEEVLVKGVAMELQKKAEKIVKTGHDKGMDEDDVRTSIMGLGIKFGHVVKIHNALLKKLGFAVDVAEIKKGIDVFIGKMKLSGEETWDQLKEFSDAVCENVENSTQARVFSQLKAAYKAIEKDMPRKPAANRGRIGAINKTLIEVFKENKKASPKDLEAALAKVVKTAKNASDYTKTYWTVCYAIANDLSVNQVLTIVAQAKETASSGKE